MTPTTQDYARWAFHDAGDRLRALEKAQFAVHLRRDATASREIDQRIAAAKIALADAHAEYRMLKALPPAARSVRLLGR